MKPQPVPEDHPVNQKKPALTWHSKMLWADDHTLYVKASDGIWKCVLGDRIRTRWHQMVAASDLGPLFTITPSTKILLFARKNSDKVKPDIWKLPLDRAAQPEKLATVNFTETSKLQVTPDGKHVLLSDNGIIEIGFDGSKREVIHGGFATP